MRFAFLLAAVLAASCASGPAPAGAGAGEPRPRPDTARPARRQQAPRFIHVAALEDPSLLPRRVSATSPECDELCRKYAAAVAATKYPRAADISRNLTALVPDTAGLIWNQKGQILMSTWTSIGQFSSYKPGQPIDLQGDTWWTAAPFMQDFCRGARLTGEGLRVRIAQRLGMPATTANDGFVQVWIDPQYIFRPCPDPEIEDHECQVQIPMIPPFTRTDDEPPWACSGAQRPGEFVAVQDSHLQWMCTNWTGSYQFKDPGLDFPWTALGYTYDWGQADHVGPSEFVTLDGTAAVFASAVATDQYCSSPPAQ
jgi:hypothetical protein